MSTKQLALVLAMVGLPVFTANATLLAPGTGPTNISAETVGPGATLLADTGTQTVSGSINGTTLSVTYSEQVYSDPNGLCNGCLDFVIQATNNGSSNTIINRVTASNFAGAGGTAQTDVGYNTAVNGGTALTGAIFPNQGDRQTADVVGFDFNSTVVNPGQYTYYLIIRTDQTNYVPGSVSFQDGVTAFGTGFGVAPEPNLIALMSLAFLGIIGATWRRKKKATE